MVWPFKGKKEKSGFEKMQEQDKLLRVIQLDARSGNSLGLYRDLAALVDNGFLNDPLSWQVLGGVIDILAEKQPREGLGLAIWLLQHTKNDDTRHAIAEKSFSLIGRDKATDPKTTASAAMTCLIIASAMPLGSEDEKKARSLWHKSVDTLARTDSGVGFAFAAASNAILSREGNAPLKAEALQKWEEIVTELAKRDRKAALEETARVATGYTNFGMDALPFRQKAIRLMYNLPR